MPDIKSEIPLNISKLEQRVLHVLAQGGAILHLRDDTGKICEITCYTRDGTILSDCDMDLFRRLKRRRFIKSVGSGPYRVTRHGIVSVRAQLDNR